MFLHSHFWGSVILEEKLQYSQWENPALSFKTSQQRACPSPAVLTPFMHQILHVEEQ